MKAISLLALFLAVLSPSIAQDSSVLIYRPTERVTRDFDDMVEVRVVRVLVAHSMTNFFIDAGQPRGFEYEMMQEYEKHLNKDRDSKDLQIDVVYIPLLFPDLLNALNEGIGDIVAANMTVTSERENLAAFTNPYRDEVSEIVVASKAAAPLSSLDDLAGHKVFVKPNSSYGLHLKQLNETFAKKGLKPIKITHPSENLDTEDILELVHAGIIDYTVADRPIAELWSQNLSDMKLYNDLEVNTGGKIAWAVRKNNPELLASLNSFVAEHRKGTLLGNIFFRRYFENTQWILNPMGEAHQKKLEELRAIFEKFSKQYGFDWVLMTAQGFQESRLDQTTVSRSGAIGIMQLLPSTAEYMGVANIDNVENNIQAGIKYMNYLRDKFFNDPGIDAAAKIDFTLAGYNAGPNRVERWRKKAKAQGLDPNKWFFNVERIALQEIGTETVRYVGNINKYYIAYKLHLSLRAEKRADIKALEGKG